MEKNITCLLNSLERIKLDKTAYESFQEAENVEKVYDICKKYGYDGTYEDMVEDVKYLISTELKNISEDSLKEVAGGKIGVKKGVAATLSALSVMSGAMPSSGAVETQKQVKQQSGIFNSILNKVGGLAIGAILVKIYDHLKAKPEPDKPVVTQPEPDKSGVLLYTSEAQEVFEAIKDFRNYVIEKPDLRETLVGESFVKEPCTDDMLINLTNEIIRRANIFLKKITSEHNFPYSITAPNFGDHRLPATYNGSYPTPFCYLYVCFSHVFFEYNINQLIKSNKNPILHDCLILKHLFGLINDVRFYQN